MATPATVSQGDAKKWVDSVKSEEKGALEKWDSLDADTQTDWYYKYDDVKQIVNSNGLTVPPIKPTAPPAEEGGRKRRGKGKSKKAGKKTAKKGGRRHKKAYTRRR